MTFSSARALFAPVDCRCAHGVCDNRPGSMGMCRRGSCQEGFSGELCDQTATPCNSDGILEHCHIHAKCVYHSDQTMLVSLEHVQIIVDCIQVFYFNLSKCHFFWQILHFLLYSFILFKQIFFFTTHYFYSAVHIIFYFVFLFYFGHHFGIFFLCFILFSIVQFRQNVW